MTTKTCPICFREFETEFNNGVYCSEECEKQSRKKYIKQDKPVKKKKELSLEEAVKRATSLGMTYGEYMVKYGG